MDLSGNIIWTTDFPFSERPNSCLVTQIDSQTLVATWHYDTLQTDYDPTPSTLFFMNPSGQITDKYVYMNKTAKEIDQITPIWEQGLVGCGRNYILHPNSYEQAGWAFRMNENHEIVWDRTYTDTSFGGRPFGLNHIIPTSDGGYIAVGTLSNNMTGVFESHNWILKLDSMGCVLPGCGDVNYVTKTEEVVFLKGKDILVYPNPADGFVRIRFPAEFSPADRLDVFLIASFGGTILKQTAAPPQAELDLSAIPAGSYFLVIRQGNEIITSKKIIVH